MTLEFGWQVKRGWPYYFLRAGASNAHDTGVQLAYRGSGLSISCNRGKELERADAERREGGGGGTGSKSDYPTLNGWGIKVYRLFDVQ